MKQAWDNEEILKYKEPCESQKSREEISIKKLGSAQNLTLTLVYLHCTQFFLPCAHVLCQWFFALIHFLEITMSILESSA